jgi:hypothetical protein
MKFSGPLPKLRLQNLKNDNRYKCIKLGFKIIASAKAAHCVPTCLKFSEV